METQTIIESEKTFPGTYLQTITPFIWFDSQAEEAVNFYTSLFKNSKSTNVTHYTAEGAVVSGREKGSVMTVAFQIEGQGFAAINGGPIFKINPAISFFVNCRTHEELEALWAKLSRGGTILMNLDTYPFSEKYGWVQDKFGVSWQLILQPRNQKITPCLMFAGDQHKKAEEAIHFYTSVFKNSGILQMERYKAGEGPEGAVVHAKFTLAGQEFTAMDSHMVQPITFNPAISLVVNCKTQDEVDYFWDKLIEGGDENSQQCGWLQDKYGVSWQIVPEGLDRMMNDPDPGRSGNVMKALLKMKKIDLNALKLAYRG